MSTIVFGSNKINTRRIQTATDDVTCSLFKWIHVVTNREWDGWRALLQCSCFCCSSVLFLQLLLGNKRAAICTERRTSGHDNVNETRLEEPWRVNIRRAWFRCFTHYNNVWFLQCPTHPRTEWGRGWARATLPLLMVQLIKLETGSIRAQISQSASDR